MNASALEAILRRDRAIIIVALGVLTTLAWFDLVWLANDMAMDGMEMTRLPMIPAGQVPMMPASSPWQPIEFAFVFAMWVVMMIGMMMPSAAPIILIHARCFWTPIPESRPLSSTGWFAGGYLLAWVAFSAVATLAQWALERAALLTPMMASAEQNCRRHPVDPRRALPMDTAEGHLLIAVPSAAWVHLAPRRLPRGCDQFIDAGLSPRRLLSRMLLGADGCSLRLV